MMISMKLYETCSKKGWPVFIEHLSKMLRDGAEENVQLCVYVDEKCVVDLYGTAIGTVYILGL